MKLSALVLAALLLLTACSQKEDQSSVSSAPPESSASAEQSVSSETEPLLGSFTTTDLDGNEVDQSIFEDYSLTMINVWATYCGPCLNEMPDLGELSAEYADKGVQIIGIVLDVYNQDATYSESQIELAKEIAKQTGADYPHLLPSEDLLYARLLEITGVPETFFEDQNGAIVGGTHSGARSKDKWTAIIDKTLEEVA